MIEKLFYPRAKHRGEGTCPPWRPRTRLPSILPKTKTPRWGILSTATPELKNIFHPIRAKTAAMGKSFLPRSDALIWPLICCYLVFQKSDLDGIQGVLFLLFSERIVGYKEVSLGFV